MRPCKLKLNQKPKRLYILIEFFFSEQNLLLQHWKFFNKNVSHYVKNLVSCHSDWNVLINLYKKIS